MRRRLAPAALAALAVAAPAHAATAHAPAPSSLVPAAHHGVRLWTIPYESHNGGATRNAYVVLPAWYGVQRNPPIPLVISPHGRGLTGRSNAAIWGRLPAVGSFAVVNPDGQGRVLPAYSWGSFGQIEDLAAMPQVVRRELPFLRIARHRIYAFGGSMGGQESLLLLARHPRMFAGVAVFDSVTDFGRQYRDFPQLHCDTRCREIWAGPLGKSLQQLANVEVGGPPWDYPRAYALRSPLTYVRSIATSCVPLQVWWSDADQIVIDQRAQSGKLFWTVRRLNPYAPAEAFVGFWIHSHEMKASGLLPLSLARFGLMPQRFDRLTHGLHVVRRPDSSEWCTPARAGAASGSRP